MFVTAHKENTQIVKLAAFIQQRKHAHTDFAETSDGAVCSYKLSYTLFIAPNSSLSKEQGRQRETSEIAIKFRNVSKLEQSVFQQLKLGMQKWVPGAKGGHN